MRVRGTTIGYEGMLVLKSWQVEVWCMFARQAKTVATAAV
jgi:hypothetical protein